MTLDTYIQKLAKIEDPKALEAALIRALEAEGATYAVIMAVPINAGGRCDNASIVLDTFPQAVSKYYQTQNAGSFDPFFDAALTLGKPVQFSEVQMSLPWDDKQKDLWAAFGQSGIRDGLSMPIIHRPGCLIYAGLGFSKRRDMPKPWRRRISVIIEEYCVRRSELSHDKGYEMFTHRERQVLAGVVNGKSNSLIATTLGLSDHTVATYVKRAFAKLGTKTRLETTLCLLGMSDTSAIEAQLTSLPQSAAA